MKRRSTRVRTLWTPTPTRAFFSYIALGIWAFIVLFPIYWLAVTSLKTPIEVDSGPFYIPGVDFKPTLDAWHYILVDLGNDTLRPYLNTIVVALCSSVLALFFGASAAYGLVRFSYKPRLGSIGLFVLGVLLAIVLMTALKLPWQLAVATGFAIFLLLALTLGRRFRRSLGNGDIAFWLISQRMLPPVAAVIPIYVLFQQVGLLDTQIALIIAYLAANLPIVVWLMRDYFNGIPIELEECAAIDGASHYRVFRSIVLPLAVPGLMATFLFVLVFSWNEYLLALFLSSARSQTMPLIVAAQNATRGPQWWNMSVLILIMIAPVILMAIALERFIARGLLIGAVKG